MLFKINDFGVTGFTCDRFHVPKFRGEQGGTIHGPVLCQMSNYLLVDVLE